MESKFTHVVSKGSRFNQIYIPKEAQPYFQVGDKVEVKLIEKSNKLYYSKNLKKLSKFKERLIREIFLFLSKFKEIEQIFIFGSFLTKKVEYRDIDILVLVNKEDQNLERIINEELMEEFNLKFQVIVSERHKSEENLQISPIDRSMFYYYVSNKEFKIPTKTKVNENHIQHLLMMPQDLLKIKLPNGKIYYDSLRKLITIERFLKNDEIAPNKIEEELTKLIDEKKLILLKENMLIEGRFLNEVRDIIKEKLVIIDKLLKNGKK